MKDKLEKRLAQLKQEMEAGQTQLQQLLEQKSNLEQTLLRISGAVQVLEEELKETEEPELAEQEA